MGQGKLLGLGMTDSRLPHSQLDNSSLGHLLLERTTWEDIEFGDVISQPVPRLEDALERLDEATLHSRAV